MAKRKRKDHVPAKNPAPPAGALPLAPARRLPALISFLLVVVTAFAFWQVGRCGFINYDDVYYVTGNSQVKQGITPGGLAWAFTTGHASNWHPLTWISHMADVQLFGLRPAWHHLMNLFFHLANTVLLFLVLHRMTKAPWQSAFVAALFALHPLHVQSVAWVAERKDVLSTFFWFLTMGAYVLYVERPVLKRYVAVCGFFALGLMAKPMLVTLPFVLLLLDYWPLGRLGQKKQPQRTGQGKGGQGRGVPAFAPAQPAVFRWATVRPLLVEKVPLFVLAALSCVATFLAQHHGGAMQAMEILPPGERLANALVSYIAYMGKMFWPVNLAVFYPHPGSWPSWKVAGAAAILLLLTALAMRMGRKFPYAPVGWLWYVGTLIPVIGIVQVGSQAMADRYTYIPLIGLFMVAAWGIPELLARLPRRREVLAALTALCLACFFFRTWTEVSYWRDDITLYTRTLAVTEGNNIIHMNRGVAYGALGNFSAAAADLEKAVGINPRVALAHVDLGIAYTGLGDFTRAIAAFNKALEIDPRYAHAYRNRGVAHSLLGDHTRAIADLTRTVEIDPQYAAAYENRGASYGALGNHTRAVADFTRAIEIDPGFAAAYRNRANARRALGDHAGAMADLARAAQIDPRYAVGHGRGTTGGKP